MHRRFFKSIYIILPVLIFLSALVYLKSYLFFDAQKAHIHTLPKAKPISVTASIVQPTIVPVNTSFSVVIPSVHINIPVIGHIDPSNTPAYEHALAHGAVEAKKALVNGTTIQGANPGEGGNIFIFAHSNVPWGSTAYFASAFSGLKDVQLKDMVYVYYNNAVYIYEVYDKEVVSKVAFDVVGPTKSEVLTLMTCWPLGVDSQRLIVKAAPVL